MKTSRLEGQLVEGDSRLAWRAASASFSTSDHQSGGQARVSDSRGWEAALFLKSAHERLDLAA